MLIVWKIDTDAVVVGNKFLFVLADINFLENLVKLSKDGLLRIWHLDSPYLQTVENEIISSTIEIWETESLVTWW